MNGTADHKDVTHRTPDDRRVPSRRPSIDSSDSEDEGANEKPSRQNTLTQTGGSGNVAPAGSSGSAPKLSRKEKRAQKSKHRKINAKHPEFELTYDMMLGIRTVVGNNPVGHSITPQVGSSTSSQSAAAADMKRRQEQEALLLQQTLKLTFPGKGSSHTPAHAMRDFKFKDYSAEIFRKIRARFKIDPTEYLLCVCGNFQYLEFISNSKSGQFFFYSHDRQYMIKTISGAECKFLREILPSYLEHVEKNPQTLLTRFYGMHRVKPHKKKEVHFLIMGSVFFTSKFVHTVFDLKGSKQGRNATEKEKKSGAAVYKDNDFLDMGIQIKLGAERAKQLNEQISRDVAWLTGLGIMDYSLLLGIHYKDRQGDVYGPVVSGEGTAQPSKVTSTATTTHMNGSNGPMSPGALAASSLANERREGNAGNGDAELLRLPGQDKMRLPTTAEEEPTRLDEGGIYTQLHPRSNAQQRGATNNLSPEDDSSHLEPHSQNTAGIGIHDPMHTPTHRSTKDPSGRSPYDVTTAATPRSSLHVPTISPIKSHQQPTLTIPSATNHDDWTVNPLADDGGSDDDEPVVHFHYDEDVIAEEVATAAAVSSSHHTQKYATLPAPSTPLRKPHVPSSPNQRPQGLTPSAAAAGDLGPFSSRTWTGGVSSRTVRSQSVLPAGSSGQGGPNGTGNTSGLASNATSPTTAAQKQAEAAARTKKELAAAAKLDAIAKQTAYGLPKKYNTVSKPGDIAFPFEFEEGGLGPGSAPISPANVGHHSPQQTNISPPTRGLAGQRSADHTPTMRGLDGGNVAAGTIQPTFDLLPPPSTTIGTPTHTTAGNGTSTPLPPRAMSVFASPNSREALSFQQQRERGTSATGTSIPFRSVLQSPVGTTAATTALTIDTQQSQPQSSSNSPNIRPIAAVPLGDINSVTVHTNDTNHHLPANDPLPSAMQLGDEQKSNATTVAAGSISVGSSSSAPVSPLSPEVHDPTALDLFGTDGGCAGQNPDGTPNNEIYFMGIIDILQQWNFAKKSERIAKVYLLNNRSNEISAAPPDEYAERFKRFVQAACQDIIHNQTPAATTK